MVVQKGKPWCSINDNKSPGSLIRILFDPNKAIGRLAIAITSRPALTLSELADAIGAKLGISGIVSVAVARATSSGRSRCTGPLGSDIAISTASATVAAT